MVSVPWLELLEIHWCRLVRYFNWDRSKEAEASEWRLRSLVLVSSDIWIYSIPWHDSIKILTAYCLAGIELHVWHLSCWSSTAPKYLVGICFLCPLLLARWGFCTAAYRCWWSEDDACLLFVLKVVGAACACFPCSWTYCNWPVSSEDQILDIWWQKLLHWWHVQLQVASKLCSDLLLQPGAPWSASFSLDPLFNVLTVEKQGLAPLMFSAKIIGFCSWN